MARKQAEIPGFERQIQNPAVEAAADAFVEASAAWSAAGKERARKHVELLVTMKGENVMSYEFPDENGEYVTVRRKVGEEKVVIERNGDADSAIGEGLSSEDEAATAGGLLDDAARAQASVGVAEDDEGNVVPPDVAAPKKKRGGKRAVH